MTYSPVPGAPVPAGPPIPSTPVGPYGPDQPYRPPFLVKARKVGAPLALLIVCGIVVAVLLAFFFFQDPLFSIIGFLLSTVAMALVILAYLWLDRAEPEPPRLLIMAFLWGAAIAVVFALLVELLFGFVVRSEFGQAAIVAPIVEETAKGSFLLIMLTGRRRAEMNSLTDCLIYAGIAAAGFAWFEDYLYIGQNSDIGTTLFTAVLRLILGPFAHPFFTSMTALGVYFSFRMRSTGAKAGVIALGFLAAMILHGIWNGSSALLSIFGYFVVYAVIMVPIFAIMVIVAIRSRKREQQMVAAKLPAMVAARLITPNEATWLPSLQTRRQAFAAAFRLGGSSAVAQLKLFVHAVVELAFVRDRIDRGFGTPETVVQQEEAAHAVVYARSQAPVLAGIAGFRAPTGPGAMAPGPAYPGQGYPPPGYRQPGYQQPGYPPAGYSQPGYQQPPVDQRQPPFGPGATGQPPAPPEFRPGP